jgi:hypothetical protein
MIVESWEKIKDKIETIAANPEIDGRTSAKYGRIDRRQYLKLIEALEADKQLGTHAPLYWEAIELWQKYRPNRAVPTIEDVQKMEDLANKIGR